MRVRDAQDTIRVITGLGALGMYRTTSGYLRGVAPDTHQLNTSIKYYPEASSTHSLFCLRFDRRQVVPLSVVMEMASVAFSLN